MRTAPLCRTPTAFTLAVPRATLTLMRSSLLHRQRRSFMAVTSAICILR
jgi:hypothetical protein